MKKINNRQKRHLIIRKKVKGTKDMPRLSVFRSNKNMYVQVIDDIEAKTLLGMSSKIIEKAENKTDRAYKLGVEFGKSILKKGIKKVVFDRGGNKYHGRVKAFADGAREAGVKF